jgi:hypothetical protein
MYQVMDLSVAPMIVIGPVGQAAKLAISIMANSSNVE